MFMIALILLTISHKFACLTFIVIDLVFCVFDLVVYMSLTCRLLLMAEQRGRVMVHPGVGPSV